MPELPEVETIARQLDQVLSGREVCDVRVRRSGSFCGDPKLIVGKKIERVSRKAKMIVFYLESFDKVIVGHLKMTGQLVWRNSASWKTGEGQVAGGHPTADWVKELPGKHTRVEIEFGDGSVLFFNDLRTFGWLRLVSKSELGKIVNKLPPDVVDGGFSLEHFEKVVSGSSRAIKQIIMDATKIGGVGNIYANDALYLAGINPRLEGRSLDRGQISNLYKAIKEVIGKGIKYGGATASDEKYVNAEGLGGKYQEHFLVYDQSGKVCGKCGSRIEKFKLGGRGTYWCPVCQE